MVEQSILRHLLSDDKSLSAYFNGTIKFDEIFSSVRRRLLLMERNTNRQIPDHHYRLQQESNLAGINTLDELLTTGLHNLATEHLELRGARVCVKVYSQNSWQELITYIPPLVLTAAYLQYNFPLVDRSPSGLVSYFNTIVMPNAKYTALPQPYIIQLQQYMAASNGLHDLHMHLNGATETDLAWQDFLTHPQKIHDELVKGFKNPKVKEQFEQESHLLEPAHFYNLLITARKIRSILLDFIFPGGVATPYVSPKDLLNMLLNDSDDQDSGRHPFQSLLNNDLDFEFNMAVEGLMYVLVIQKLREEPKASLAWLFHYYLLILGLANRLLVQQTHQYGFEQFQKHTLNNLREESERDYRKRFFQMNGNGEANLRFLEGRFSPKATERETTALIDNIYRGWKKLKKQAKLNDKVAPVLKLTAHFIKREEQNRDSYIRFYDLRKDIWNRALVLSLLTQSYPYYGKKILGADAAASEFDTPPEVFAPVFRMLRRKGFKHFTYHAGEDFYHIFSGLRAIFEAVQFTEMRNGDRIGHATASGISVTHWRSVMGEHILIRQGEWLDNLIFVHYLIISCRLDFLKNLLPYLVNEIHKYSFEVYREVYPIKVLETAWLSRKYCPVHLFADTRESAMRDSVYEDDEWLDIKSAFPVRDNTNTILAVLEKYNLSEFRSGYDRIINVELKDFTDSEIQSIQLAILKILNEKEIVIETLPTSNVRIGYYNSFENYHLVNWLNWEKEGHAVPPIVVGSDDTGIFATNIYNEYANIYCCLINKGTSHDSAMSYIEKLDKNGSIYSFQ